MTRAIFKVNFIIGIFCIATVDFDYFRGIVAFLVGVYYALFLELLDSWLI